MDCSICPIGAKDEGNGYAEALGHSRYEDGTPRCVERKRVTNIKLKVQTADSPNAGHNTSSNSSGILFQLLNRARIGSGAYAYNTYFTCGFNDKGALTLNRGDYETIDFRQDTFDYWEGEGLIESLCYGTSRLWMTYPDDFRDGFKLMPASANRDFDAGDPASRIPVPIFGETVWSENGRHFYPRLPHIRWHYEFHPGNAGYLRA